MNATAAQGNQTAPVDSYSLLEGTVSRIMTVVILGVTINYINTAMVHTFSKHYILKTNPRYILFIHLVLNDMILLTVTVVLFLLSYLVRTVYLIVCLVLVVPAVLTSHNAPLNLVFMAVECYISVCVPLRYNQLCTANRAYIVIAIIWAINCLSILPDIILLLTSESRQVILGRVACNNNILFKNDYSKSKRNVCHILFLVIVWLTLYYTFFRILFVAKTADANATKARNTLLIHGFQVLLCMIVYVQPAVTASLLVLFPGQVRLVYFVVFVVSQILPRFTNPIVYGLRDATFRRYLKRHLSCSVTRRILPQTGPKL